MVKVKESILIAAEIADLTVELQKIRANLLHKQAEIADLEVKKMAADRDDFKKAIDNEMKAQNLSKILPAGPTGQIQN